MEYKVSIIVPIYKAERYLRPCVNSLLAQTLDSIEVILVDDGSPDDCGVICDNYAMKCKNIVALHIEHSGVSKARNIGLENAHGHYIGFVDADDYVSSDMFFELYHAARGSEAEITMCSYFIDNSQNIAQQPMEYKPIYEGREEITQELAALYSKRYRNGLYSVWNKLFDNGLLRQNFIRFDETLIRAEDAWFVFDCLKCANRVRYINKPLYYYRQIATSTMHTIQADHFVRCKAFREKVKKETIKLGIDIDNNELYYQFLFETMIYCRSLIKEGKKSEAFEILHDDFLCTVSQYGKYLPLHIKLLYMLSNKGLYRFFVFLMTIW